MTRCITIINTVSAILVLSSLTFMVEPQSNNGRRCKLIKDTKPFLPRDVESWTWQACQDPHPNETGGYRCQVFNATGGNSRFKVRPSCVCPFYIFHPNITPHICNKTPNHLNHMSCYDCIKYSPHNKGPCLNGGTPVCSKRLLVAEDITCHCPPGTTGNYCQTTTFLCSPDGVGGYKLPNNSLPTYNCCRPIQNDEDAEAEECDASDINKLQTCQLVTDSPHQNGQASNSRPSVTSASVCLFATPRNVFLLHIWLFYIFIE